MGNLMRLMKLVKLQIIFFAGSLFIINVVQARLNRSCPKALCCSINRMFMDDVFVEIYGLTPELLGLVLRGIPGLDVNMRDTGNGSVCLHYAHQYGQILVLRTLIFAGALVNIQNNREQTPLFIEQFSCTVNLATVQALLANGIDLTLLDDQNRRACDVVHPDIAALMRPKEQQQLARLTSAQDILRSRAMVEALITIILTYGIC